MKKNLEEKKYLGIFKSKSGSALSQLQVLLQFLGNPEPILLANSGFFKNLLNEYYLLSNHPNHNLVITLLAIIAFHEKKHTELHHILLKIVYMGQFDHFFLCASLSCIARFVGKNECSERIYLAMDVDQESHLSFDQIDRLVQKHAGEFDELIEEKNQQKLCAFYLQSSSMLQLNNCTCDIAFQFFLNSQTTVSLQNLVDLWVKLFFYCVSNALDQWPTSIDSLAIALLNVIVTKSGGFSKVLKKVSFATLMNYLSDYSHEFYKVVFLLKTLEVLLIKPEKIHRVEKEKLGEIIFTIIFVDNQNPDILLAALDNAKKLLFLSEYDNDFLTGIRRFFKLYVKSANFDEKMFNQRLDIIINYLCEINSSVVLNSLVKTLADYKKYFQIAKALSSVPPIKGQVAISALQPFNKTVITEFNTLNPENYICSYILSVSTLAAKNRNEFNELVSLIVSTLNRKHGNYEAVFTLIINILTQHCHHRVFTEIQLFGQLKTSNQKRLSKAFLAFINNSNEILLVLRFITQAGKHLVKYFDLTLPDINAILSGIINYLSENSTNSTIVLKIVEYLAQILAEQENMICIAGINTLFVENIIVCLEEGLNVHLLPVIHLLLNYANKLEMDECHIKRIQRTLLSISMQLIEKDTPESRATLFTMLCRMSFDNFKDLFQALSSDEHPMLPYLVTEVVPSLEEDLVVIASPLKALVTRVFE